MPVPIRATAGLASFALAQNWLYRFGTRLLPAVMSIFKRDGWIPSCTLSSQPLDESAAAAAIHGRFQRLVEECALRQWKGFDPMTNPVIENIRRSLGRTAQTPLDPRPAIYESRPPESLDSESERFLEEVRKLSGVGQKLSPADVDAALQTLVPEQNIHKATVWETPYLRATGDYRNSQLAGRGTGLPECQ